MQDYQLQSQSEPSSATPSLQSHPHYNSTWVPEDYSTINNKKINIVINHQYKIQIYLLKYGKSTCIQYKGQCTKQYKVNTTHVKTTKLFMKKKIWRLTSK